MSEQAKCGLCGEPMPAGEEMFKYHGYSGPCPKPPLPRQPTLEQLLRMTVAGERTYFTPPFCVSVQGERDGGIHFIIHADGYDSETLDFVARGDELERL